MNKKKTEEKETAEDTVARLRANRALPQKIDVNNSKAEENKLNQNISTQPRVSKNTTAVSTTERKNAVNDTIKRLLFDELTQGQALKELRVNILGLKQDVYAQLVDVSRKTLSDIENDRGRYHTDILNKVFKPFGLKVGLLPTSPHLLSTLIADREC